MSETTIQIKCTRCLGTGIDDNLMPPGPCMACGGDGLVGSAVVDTTDIMDELDWLKKKIKKILNQLEIPEE
jgi:hypothetical protein